MIYKGGITVDKGLYWDPMEGQRFDMGQGEVLPGDSGRIYVRISPVGLVLIAPLFGMMYVMFLPLFGIGVFIVSWLVIIINAVATVALSGVQVCNRVAGRGISFNWQPSKAHFSGFTRKKKKSGESGKRRTK